MEYSAGAKVDKTPLPPFVPRVLPLLYIKTLRDQPPYPLSPLMLLSFFVEIRIPFSSATLRRLLPPNLRQVRRGRGVL